MGLYAIIFVSHLGLLRVARFAITTKLANFRLISSIPSTMLLAVLVELFRLQFSWEIGERDDLRHAI